jgi:hypothetical protein
MIKLLLLYAGHDSLDCKFPMTLKSSGFFLHNQRRKIHNHKNIPLRHAKLDPISNKPSSDSRKLLTVFKCRFSIQGVHKVGYQPMLISGVVETMAN